MRKAAGEALRESEERYRTLVESALDGIVIHAGGQVAFANRAAAAMLGFAGPDALVGQPLASFVHPDDVASAADRVRRVQAGEAVAYPVEVRYVKRDGTELPVENTGVLVTYEGEPAVLLVIRDITARKRTEETLRERVKELQCLYSITNLIAHTENLDGILQGSADAMPNAWFYPDIACARIRFEGRSYQTENFRETDWRQSADFTVRGQPVGVVELYYLEERPTRDEGPFLTDERRLIDAIAERLGRVAERKRAEEARDTLQAQLHQARKAESLGRMAGAIAHHHNNLLGAVLLNLEMAQIKLPSDAGARKYLADATNASHRAAEIGHQMLAYLGQSTGRREAVDLGEICREALRPLRSSLLENEQITTAFPSHEVTVQGDPAQLRRILTNLAENAAEAIGDGEGDITVAIEVIAAGDMRASPFHPVDWTPQAETYACVSVTDTGCGMSPETLDRLFDPFFSTKLTGRGLGVPVVMGIVRAHDGACSVASALGRGTTFRVYLPLVAEQPRQSRVAEPVEARAVEGRSLVLVVDDEPMLRNSTRSILRLLGYEVLEAADGAEAVEVFRQHHDRIRCVLCDLTMPHLDGWATLKALRSIRPDVAVILTSGYDEAQVMASEQPERPQAFLQKPYASADLKAALAAALKER